MQKALIIAKTAFRKTSIVGGILESECNDWLQKARFTNPNPVFQNSTIDPRDLTWIVRGSAELISQLTFAFLYVRV